MTGSDEEIHRDVWQKTLEALTSAHQGDVATIEVTGVDVGGQYEAESAQFSYVEFDPHDDAVSVGVGGRDGDDSVVLRHTVGQPQHIFVHGSEGDVTTIEVRSLDDTVTLITLRARMELPA